MQNTQEMIEYGKWFQKDATKTAHRSKRKKNAFIYIFNAQTYITPNKWALWSMNLSIYLISFELNRKGAKKNEALRKME